MYPTLSIRFSNPLRKCHRLPEVFPDGLTTPRLPAECYRNRDTCIVHESLPGFGLSFGHVQVSNTRILRGTWRVSAPCVVITYSEQGQVQLAIRGYGDAIAPLGGWQSGAPVPAGKHVFFANAGVHRLYYFAVSLGMLHVLAGEFPPLMRLLRIPDLRNNDPWQNYVAGEEDFGILRVIVQSNLNHLRQHHFLQQQFRQLMGRYSERIGLYADNPDEQGETVFMKAVAYIREQYTDPDLSMATIAEAVHLSVAALEKHFQRNAFRSTKFINALRAYHGADLLSDTGLPIGDISTLSGFRNRRRFAVVFREKFGLSPNEYRNNLKIRNK